MCCHEGKPVFKGVVVKSGTNNEGATTTTVAMVSFMLFGILIPAGQALSVTSPLASAKLTRSDNPYCVYLDKSQEMDCICGGHDQDDSESDKPDSAPVTFPSAEFVMLAENKSLASIKIHSCDFLKIRLDLRPLPRPFYRIRIEDVGQVLIEGITILPDDIIDIFIRNVNGSALITGAAHCAGCDDEDDDSSKDEQLTMHFLSVKNVNLSEVIFVNTIPKVKVRDVDSFHISETLFVGLDEMDPISVQNVLDVSIDHAEFVSKTDGANITDAVIVLNQVQNLQVNNTVLPRSAVKVESDAARTMQSWNCTVNSREEIGKSNCSDKIGLSRAITDDLMASMKGTSGSAGAIALAAISAGLLVAAVSVLAFLHKTGKLEQYI